jgi:hypothetical protein
MWKCWKCVQRSGRFLAVIENAMRIVETRYSVDVDVVFLLVLTSVYCWSWHRLSVDFDTIWAVDFDSLTVDFDLHTLLLLIYLHCWIWHSFAVDVAINCWTWLGLGVDVEKQCWCWGRVYVLNFAPFRLPYSKAK